MKNLFLKIYRLVRRPVNRLLNKIDPPVVVLLYHRVASLPSDSEMLAVTPDNFRAHLKFLKKTFPLVRFEEDWTKLSKPAVAVTFDDGYADNALQVLPIMEEMEVPATFFVSTGTIDTILEFWWNEVESIVLEGRNLPSSFTMKMGRFKKIWPTGSEIERRLFYQELVRYLTNADSGQRDGLLSQLRDWALTEQGVAATNRAMTVEELRRLAESRLATIGAHTVTHTRLASLPASLQRQEIMDSKRQLETWLHREITVFSYPFGKRNDYTKETVALCREAGFAKAATNVPGQAHRWTDPHRIPRLLVRNWPVEIFTGMLENFWTK
jgi:peptidoglycan/xylan/chitin deacetylase (PgdA/CDA1 family)